MAILGSSPSLSSSSTFGSCQLCLGSGHSACYCPQLSRFGRSPVLSSVQSSFAGLQIAPTLQMRASQPAPYDHGWYLNTGASTHMIGNPTLQQRSPYMDPDSVLLSNGDKLPISYTGNMALPLGSSSFRLNNVFVIPSMRKKLLFIAQFYQDNNVLCAFDSRHFCIFDLTTSSLRFQGLCKNGLYQLLTLPPRLQALSACHKASSLWHNRLGHPSSKLMSFLGLNKIFSSKFKFTRSFCQGCALGKSTHLPFQIFNKIHTTPFNLVHFDVWQSLVVSISGYKYYLLFSNDCTWFTWLYFMRRKSEVIDHFKNFLAYFKTQFSAVPKQFQSDGSGEYGNGPFKDLCSSHRIHHHLSYPYTPEHNGLVERKRRHITDMAHTLLITNHVPLFHWVDAISIAVHLINRLPSPVLQWSSPFSRLYGQSPSYSELRVFGCACYPYLGDYLTNKLFSRITECVFLGYNLQHKGYRCLDRKTNRVYISRHVQFDEQTFPFAKEPSHSRNIPSEWAFIPLVSPALEAQPQSASPTVPLDQPTLPNCLVVEANEAPSSLHFLMNPLPYHYQHRPSQFSVPLPNDARGPPLTNNGSSSEPDSSPPPFRLHTTTRLQVGSQRPLVRHDGIVRYPLPRALITQISTIEEPTCYRQAVRVAEWRQAMTTEFNALLKNQAWELVPPNPKHNVIGCKWVFKIRRRFDGSIERYKAHLVAKGFHQQLGIDYNETFSAVIKPTSICTILSLVVSYG